jgi:hypothetical protein
MQRVALWGSLSLVAIALASAPASAFGIFGSPGLHNGLRWDAAPHYVAGQDRSLTGGLSYSVQGGSYEAFRNLFAWSFGVPSVDVFRATIDHAFAQWTVVDPATGLGTALRFVADPDSAVQGPWDGAEIDLLGSIDGYNWDPGQTFARAETSFFSEPAYNGITLTSGTTHYPGQALTGADITFNTNGYWTLPILETVLTHEIGHALGLDDVETAGSNGRFIDDNFSCPVPSTCRATLSNSFAAMIDPYNPAASPLHLYTIAPSDPGVYSAPILMQSYISNEIYAYDQKLQNDDFAGRQFLYPFVVPEPASLPLAGVGLVAFAAARRSRAN